VTEKENDDYVQFKISQYLNEARKYVRRIKNTIVSTKKYITKLSGKQKN
jgi:hypothetical protein